MMMIQQLIFAESISYIIFLNWYSPQVLILKFWQIVTILTASK